MENLRIYEQLAEVPPTAIKEILGGRLKGFSDINPMWRIKQITEVFGPCGIGWMYDIVAQRIEEGANGEKAAFVDILFYYKDGDEWSKPIPGSGGSMFVSKEKNGLYTDDECFKKALTDAIGIAGKALGLAATVYWQKDRTKYSSHGDLAVDPDAVDTSDLDVSDGVAVTCACGAVLPQARIDHCNKNMNGEMICFDCQSKNKKKGGA